MAIGILAIILAGGPLQAFPTPTDRLNRLGAFLCFIGINTGYPNRFALPAGGPVQRTPLLEDGSDGGLKTDAIAFS